MSTSVPQSGISPLEDQSRLGCKLRLQIYSEAASDVLQIRFSSCFECFSQSRSWKPPNKRQRSIKVHWDCPGCRSDETINRVSESEMLALSTRQLKLSQFCHKCLQDIVCQEETRQRPCIGLSPPCCYPSNLVYCIRLNCEALTPDNSNVILLQNLRCT